MYKIVLECSDKNQRGVGLTAGVIALAALPRYVPPFTGLEDKFI